MLMVELITVKFFQLCCIFENFEKTVTGNNNKIVKF